MTTLKPRQPYSADELAELYPSGLKLEQVQVLLRHGERTPVNARFRNAGVPAYWPYCGAAQQLRSAILAAGDKWDHLAFQRRLETFSKKDNDDSVVLSTGPRGETEGICLPGELTDVGRRTTFALGSRLRHLYVDQLGYLPSTLTAAAQSQLYLRATPIPRALESVQQTFAGLYPRSNREADLPPPAIVTRQASDETLFPNEGTCKRFNQLSLAFGERAAEVWNDSPELRYVTSRIGKWMPDNGPKQVKVDSHPRLSGIMDHISSTLAHGPETRLPKEFYDEKLRSNIEKIAVEEWFAGFVESNEYRKLGIGSLVGDITARLVERARAIEQLKVTGNSVANGKDVRFALSGCHDTTLAAILASLGAFKDESWPPYSSHIAVELFRGTSSTPSADPELDTPPSAQLGLWERIFGPAKNILKQSPSSRLPLNELPSEDRAALNDFYVRLRYNDRPMPVPGCSAAGKHYRDDKSICTLAAFKQVADKITPKDWKTECGQRIGESAFPAEREEAGY